ncbi:hypothetical protein [Serratia sp. (in: enterobacteria)]|uniref:hypothetical protein n=1 Tax=Serratia sp. (in: enterobacteria) TaxID=616 RepID=UPI003988E120
MKTKHFKSFAWARKSAATSVVFIRDTEQKAFVHSCEVSDFNDSIILERSFSWTDNDKDKRTLRVFRLRNGDTAFRAFGSGIGNDERATSIFDHESDAIEYINKLADEYKNSDKGWKEVL